MKTSGRRYLYVTLTAVLLVVLLIMMVMNLASQGKEKVTPSEFYEMFEKGEIEKFQFQGSFTVRVQKTGSQVKNFPSNYDFAINVGSRANFENRINEIIKEYKEKIHEGGATPSEAETAILARMQKAGTYDVPSNVNIWQLVGTVVLVGGSGIIAFILIKNIRQQNNQSIEFGKSKARVNENVKVRFTDVAGAEEEKEELQEIIEFLKSPQKFNELGARIPHGVLLVGPPGTGKTLFAKAVAGEAGVPFFSISGSDFVEMFVGVGASRVRDIFDQAKRNMPCIIFIDEIDAVGRQRGAGLGGGHDEREQALNQLLVQMDGFETNTGITVMAATNRADILDPALMRPGRFDRQIYINRPDVRGREAILKIHARNKPISPEVEFQLIARITAGFTGADLENLLNEAAILAVRADRKRITMADITEGINKVLMGPQKKSRLVTERDKRVTAYHEAGHAILASFLKHCDPVQEVTIIPRGMAGGYTLTRPSNDDNYITKAQLMDEIAMFLGGRVAEELVMQSVSSGASADIKNLTRIAHDMVAELGMSEAVGPVYYGAEHEIFVGKSYQTQAGHSENMAATIDAETNKIVLECHKNAAKILSSKIEILHAMARVLLEKETIHADEVEMLIKGKSAEEVIKFIDKKYNPPEEKAEIKTTSTTQRKEVPAQVEAPSLEKEDK